MVVTRMMRHRFAPLPARVTAVSATQRGATRADIQPLINIPQQDRETKEITYAAAQEIPDVPVVLIASEASDQSLKLAPGDIGLYVPTMYSLAELIDTDETEPVDVADPNQQQYQYGVFIPLRWNRTLPSGATAADRAILGDDVRIGDPATAESIAFKASTQSAIDDIYAELAEIGAQISLANGSGSGLTSVPGTGAYTPGDAPTVDGTDNLTGS